MRRYIPVLLSSMAFSLISCGEVMDLTKPEKAEVTYSDITLSLYQTGKYDLYLDKPDYQYTIMVEKSHCEKEAKAEFAIVDAKEFGEEYSVLPTQYYSLDGDNLEFKGDDVLRVVNLRFHDLTTLDGKKKYVLGLKLVSNDLAVNEEKNTMTFFLQQKEGEIDNPYILTTAKDLITLSDKLKDGKTTYAKLQNDIDLQGIDWQPIETSVSRQIAFDGNGHTIRNLKIATSSSANQGFFGMLIGRCSNVKFENAQITANQKMAGILAGQVGNTSGSGIVENVQVSGSIQLTSGTGAPAWDNGQAGGICGRLQGAGSKVYQCSVSETNIKATWSAGGICGEVKENATVSQCCFQGEIVTQSCVGGIVGRMLQAVVTQCYSTGKAQAYPMLVANPAGGIAGFVDPSPTALISYCYSECELSAQNQVGGIMGLANKETGITVTHCVAWNLKLFSNGAPRSGKVCGFFKKNKADKCYTNPAMVCQFSGNPVLTDQESLNGTGAAADRFNGLTSNVSLIETAKTLLAWDQSIWNFDGEKPRLAWELAE